MAFYHNINPALFSIGDFQIRYYGLMYILGILFVWLFIKRFHKKFGLDLDSDTIADIVFFLVVGLFIGGRLGYVIFYNFRYFFEHPIEIVQFWKGGMSFHGGFFLCVAILYLYCKRRKLDFLKVGDLIAVPLPIALAFGRLGNFLNGELWGRPWAGPWAFLFQSEQNMLNALGITDRVAVPRHPSQLYEILKNLTIFGTLLSLRRFKPRKGTLFFSFFALYGIFRIIIEFFREPEITWLGITMGQWLSIPLVIFGAGGLIYIYSRKQKASKELTEEKKTAKKKK